MKGIEIKFDYMGGSEFWQETQLQRGGFSKDDKQFVNAVKKQNNVLAGCAGKLLADMIETRDMMLRWAEHYPNHIERKRVLSAASLVITACLIVQDVVGAKLSNPPQPWVDKVLKRAR